MPRLKLSIYEEFQHLYSSLNFNLIRKLEEKSGFNGLRCWLGRKF